MPKGTTTHRPTEPQPERPSRPLTPATTAAPATPAEPLPAGAAARGSELVAHADRALAALDASGDHGKKLRESARTLLRGASVASAAGFLAAAAVAREHEEREGRGEADLVLATESAARSLLEAAGAVADASPGQAGDALRREAVADAAPAGTVLRVLAPSWRSASGELLAAGVALVSAGPRPALEAPLERAFRAARRLARRAEDVASRASELGAGLGALDEAAQVQRALDAVRFVEALAAVHATPGQDVAEAGLADLVLFLETRGVHRVPATGARVERPASEPDVASETGEAGETDSLETDHVTAKLVADASPAGTVLRRTRSAFVRDGRLVDGVKAEVTVSRGVESEDERRLEALARAEAPGSPLPRAAAKWKKLGEARHGEAGARVLIDVVRELGRERGAAGAAPKLTKALPRKGETPKAEAARDEALALAERLLASLGVERLDPRGEPAPGEAVAVEKTPDSRPEGTVVRVVEAGWRLGSRVLEPAKVVVSLGPRAALPALLDAALERAPAGTKDLLQAARARVQGLAASDVEGAGGLEAALDLAQGLDAPRGSPGPAGDETLRRELAAFIAARGVAAFPEDEASARGELERTPASFEVSAEASERPRGEVLAIGARGFRAGSGAVLRKARVRVSQGPEDPLARALGALAAAVEGTPVPGASPLARVNALRAQIASGPSASSGLAADEAIARTLETVRAAQLLAESARPDLARSIQGALDTSVFPALAACGVEVFPAPGANALSPRDASRIDAQLHDAPEAPGALLEVQRRGLARGETVYPAVVVISRGPRPRLLDAAGIAAQGGGVLEPIAPLAAELGKRLEDARRALALGTEGESRARDQALDAGLAFLRAAERLRAGLADATERASLDSFLAGQLRPALALAHEQVEVFPLAPATLDGRELEKDAAYELEHAHDAKAPHGAVLAVLRSGVRDQRARPAKVEPAKLLVSLGPRPAIDLALDDVLAALVADPLAPPGLEDKARSVREAARALVRAKGETSSTKHRESLGHAAASLLDAVEPRVAESNGAKVGPLARALDEALLPALRALGVRPFPDDGEPVSERPSGKIEVAREHSESAPRGALLRRVRRGLEVEGRAVRTARIVVSLGPRDEVATLGGELEAVLAALPAQARAPLEQALGRERAAVEDGRTGASPVDRALALLDALEDSLARAGSRAALQGREGAVAAILARMGLALFPAAGEPLPDAVARDPQALELEGERAFQGGPRGSVVAVSRAGVVQGSRVLRRGQARLDLGARPAWLDAAEEAARAGASLAPLLDRVRDPRQPLLEDAILAELADAHAACAPARPALERALASLGAEVFPRAGEPLPTGLGPDALATEAVWSDDVAAGSVVGTKASGLKRGTRVLRPAKALVSRGPMSPALRAVADLARATDLPETARTGLAGLAAKLETLASGDDADRVLAEALALLENGGGDANGGTKSAVARLVSVLRERGWVVAPDGPGGSLDALKATLGGESALEPPRRRFGAAQPGEVLAVERRAVLRGETVLAKARVVVCAGAPNELHGIVADVREKLSLESGDVSSIKELDDVLERVADAKPDRLHLLALPVMNVLHRRNLKDKLGAELKTYLRTKHVKEIVAYAGFPAAELGPKQLEEVRVNSDREKGKIVRVLRPGFVEEKTGAILQKVQAEVSR